MIKEVLYDPFGGIIEDTAPGLHVPIGFAGGLHDHDLGLVRFGWRDYDPFTGRWTAPDPIGDKGGDPDWYGYCLDDPVNANDPTGLLAFLLPFAAGMAGATAIGSTGAYAAAKVADWFGSKTDKDYGKNKPTATEGVHNAMDKVIGINAGIVGTAGATKAAPAVAATGKSLINQGSKAVKAIGDKAKQVARNPKVSKLGNAAGDSINSALPTGTPAPSKAGYAGGIYGHLFDVEDQVNEGIGWIKKQRK
nr:RHS repeat-associated core domain-containing protein [Pseudodesulfovibrio sp.]